MEDTKTEILQSSEEENYLLESNNTSNGIFNPIRWCLPPPIKKYWKTVLLATMLFLAGLVFLLVAILIVALPKFRNASSSVIFFMFGLICIIPGGYHVNYIWNSYKEKEGYIMAKIATFKDENY